MLEKVGMEREEFNGERTANVIWKAVIAVAEETEVSLKDSALRLLLS